MRLPANLQGPLAQSDGCVPKLDQIGRVSGSGVLHFEGDFHALLKGAAAISVLCVGDVMLDLTVECNPDRISPEAPVLVAARGKSAYSLGGAANVAANLVGLGVRTHLVSACGDDAEGRELLALLETTGIDASVGCGNAATTLKTRFVAQGRQLLRLDRDGVWHGSNAVHRRISEQLANWSAPLHALVISDYGKGLLDPDVIAACNGLARRLGIPILVDPKGSDWSRYGNVDLIKPNAAELAAFVDMPTDADAAIDAALIKALDNCEAEAILVTRAAAGASLALRDGTIQHFPAFAVEVSDVCGAGDTNISAIAAALAQGSAWGDAVTLGQLASAIVVQHRGTVAIDRVELEAAYDAMPHGRPGKRCSRSSIRQRLEAWRSAGLTVGFTNGCFDVFHAGHAHILRTARAQCDRLIVGLNSDASVARLKGESRPVNRQDDRLTVLECIEFVDAVVVFEEDDPFELIELIQPDRLFKGSDYDKRAVVGADIVEMRGGQVIIVPLLPGRSSTSILAGNRAVQAQ